uniref:SF4 helicase domain-containing protein n=1 Tax=Mucochytrium quahogii TaxID=96639 RepID=A0A7S2WSF3_9STRA
MDVYFGSCNSRVGASHVRFLSTDGKPPDDDSKKGTHGDRRDEIRKYLDDNKVVYKESSAAGSNKAAFVVKTCPFCHDTKGHPSNEFKLGLFENGGFNCMRCGSHGGWHNFVQGEVSKEPRSSRVDLQEKELETAPTQKYTPVDDGYLKTALQEAETPKGKAAMYRLTVDRGLDVEVAKFYKVGLVSLYNKYWYVLPGLSVPSEFGGDSLRVREIDRNPPKVVEKNYKLMFAKLRCVTEKKFQIKKETPQVQGLFGWHTVPRDSREIVITEGEFDAMAVYQATKIPTVSLPNGVESFSERYIPALKRFTKIYLWMDNDEAGTRAKNILIRSLGKKYCRVVVAPDGIKDANEALQKGVNLRQCIEHAASPLATEVDDHLFEQTLALDTLRPQIEYDILNPPPSGEPFDGFPGLTDILGGFRPGELTLFTGPTGAGKTTFLSQISTDLAARGVSTLFGSFEMSIRQVTRTQVLQFQGRKHGGVDVEHDHDKKRIQKTLEDFFQLPFRYMKFQGGSDISHVIDTMTRDYVLNDVQHIIIDNLQFMTKTEEGVGEYAALRKMELMDYTFGQFRKFASDFNVHVTLVIHPRKEPDGGKLGLDSFYGGGKSTQEADNVLILQRNKENEKQLDVRKNRFLGEMGSIPLKFDRITKRFIDISHAGVEARVLMDREDLGNDDDDPFDPPPTDVIQPNHRTAADRPSQHVNSTQVDKSGDTDVYASDSLGKEDEGEKGYVPKWDNNPDGEDDDGICF